MSRSNVIKAPAIAGASSIAVQKAVEYLEAGRVISFPTETVYALACAATNYEAINRITTIKRRAVSQVFAILVQNIEVMSQYAHIDDKIRKMIAKFSSKPLTCVLRYQPSGQHEVSPILIKDGKIGMRVPNHPVAQDILSLYGKPIVATSVNLSGEPSARSVDEMPEEVKDKIDLIIDGGACNFGVPSNVVDFTDEEPRVLR